MTWARQDSRSEACPSRSDQRSNENMSRKTDALFPFTAGVKQWQAL
jgi:hypothetical protein